MKTWRSRSSALNVQQALRHRKKKSEESVQLETRAQVAWPSKTRNSLLHCRFSVPIIMLDDVFFYSLTLKLQLSSLGGWWSKMSHNQKVNDIHCEGIYCLVGLCGSADGLWLKQTMPTKSSNIHASSTCQVHLIFNETLCGANDFNLKHLQRLIARFEFLRPIIVLLGMGEELWTGLVTRLRLKWIKNEFFKFSMKSFHRSDDEVALIELSLVQPSDGLLRTALCVMTLSGRLSAASLNHECFLNASRLEVLFTHNRLWSLKVWIMTVVRPFSAETLADSQHINCVS